ncbi:MAG: neutral/alkaline non-lysosomal ceramidase N-terminal domain-containing protein [Pseudomonadales bacterium]|nr:neutral/alkaline non-lysosomal ceramidase N-terminal domain-containing protein [Pseudomonadales bacterium]
MRVVIVILLLSMQLFAFTCFAQTYRVAAGSVDITPAEGTYLAGYGPDRKSTGAADAIHIKAALVKTGSDLLALLTIDCIGLTRPDILAIETGIAQKIPEAKVVVSSTHTHAGPDVVGIWGPAFWRSGRDEEYIAQLVETAVALVARTATQLQPATSRLASAELPLAWVENVSEPELLDRRLAVMQFVDRKGASLLTLVNYACHPTVLGPENTEVSADYVAGFYQKLTSELGGEHLFLQGAIGGWVQPLQGDRSHELALAHGESLAAAVIDLLADAQNNAYAPLVFRQQQVDVPLHNWGFRLLMWLGVLDRQTYDGAMRTSVAWFKIGEAEFVTHPGETSPAYSLASRELMDTRHSFVLGLSQDAMGYILKPEYFADDAAYPHAEYLTSVSVGATAGPLIMQAVKEVVD